MKHNLLSHSANRKSNKEFEKILQKNIVRIKNGGDKPHVTVEYQLELLHQLSSFEVGKFLIEHGGLNGFWTHYVLTYPWSIKGKKQKDQPEISELERAFLCHFPTTIATQQRFEIFLSENQKQVKNEARLACIPCGLMGELLYLNFDKISSIELIGIDLDSESLNEATSLANTKDLTKYLKPHQLDAWKLNFSNELDLISSNGLNIYEPSDAKVKKLYHKFYHALKPGGKLVTSFMTYPPSHPEKSEWDLSKIQQDQYLLLQKIIFTDVLEPKFRHFRTMDKTKTQLEHAGFKNINFISDEANIFPTAIAYK